MGDLLIILMTTHLVVAAAAFVFGHHKGSGFMLEELEKQWQQKGLDR